MHYISKYNSPFGEITIASDGDNVIGIWYDGQRYFGTTLAQGYKEKDLPIFCHVKKWLDAYFNGENPKMTLPIKLDGSQFQLVVWQILLSIPYGQTMTYGEVAMRVSETLGIASMSAQAVGNAVGRNPISIVVPCHRVVGSNGKMVGYAGGIERKIGLLKLEQSEII
jgi:methylated-DNA-[protein]-cysteine S-methyltransferase